MRSSKTPIFYLLIALSLTLGSLSTFGQSEERVLTNAELDCPVNNSGGYAICLTSVSFSGSTNQYIPILSDLGEEFEAPQFKVECNDPSNPEFQHPVGYVSGSTPTVTATFVTSMVGTYHIRGVVSEDNQTIFEFPVQTITISGTDIEYSATEASQSFEEEKIRYFEEFAIAWQISTTSEPDIWTTINESRNPLYVTYKAPIAISTVPGVPQGIQDGPNFNAKLGYNWFHTLFKVSCAAADMEDYEVTGDQTTDEAFVIDKVFEKFETLDINTADGDHDLYYYLDWEVCEAVSTAQLLEFHQGQCGSWARFFLDCLKIQGIENDPQLDDLWDGGFVDVKWRPYDETVYPGLPVMGMLIGDWEFEGDATIEFELGEFNIPLWYWAFPKLDPGDDVGSMETGAFIENSRYHWTKSQDGLADATRVRLKSNPVGQGPNERPLGLFEIHTITYIRGKYYDPSYGLRYDDLQDFRHNVDGIYVKVDAEVNEADLDFQIFDFNNDGEITDEDITVLGIYVLSKDDILSGQDYSPFEVLAGYYAH